MVVARASPSWLRCHRRSPGLRVVQRRQQQPRHNPKDRNHDQQLDRRGRRPADSAQNTARVKDSTDCPPREFQRPNPGCAESVEEHPSGPAGKIFPGLGQCWMGTGQSRVCPNPWKSLRDSAGRFPAPVPDADSGLPRRGRKPILRGELTANPSPACRRKGHRQDSSRATDRRPPPRGVFGSLRTLPPRRLSPITS